MALRAAGADAFGASRNAEAGDVRLDFREPATFAQALEGVDRVFLLRPPQIVRVRGTLNRFVDAAVAAGVRHCVFLSVEGADANRRVPHHAVETHLRASGLGWTFVRPGFFAQNLTGAYLGDVRRGRLVLPAGEGAVAWVDTRDLGEAAARILLDPAQHTAQAYHATGRDAVTYGALASLLSDELGRRIEYEPVSVPRYALHLLRREHASPARIAVLSLLHTHVRRGRAAPETPDLERLLGRRPRTIADFIADHHELLGRATAA